MSSCIYLLISGLHLKTCAPTWQQSWVVAFMDTVHRKQRCYCHGSPLRQLVWIAGTCLVEFPTKSRGCGVWVVGVTKYAFFGVLPYRAIRQSALQNTPFVVSSVLLAEGAI